MATDMGKVRAEGAEDERPGEEPGEGEGWPGVIAIQPRPLVTRIGHHRNTAGTVTAITRVWRPGDSARCRLCDRCTAWREVCLIQVGEFVPYESGPLFSIVSRVVQRDIPLRR